LAIALPATSAFLGRYCAVKIARTYESIKAFSETDFTEELKKIDVPTLVMHGEDDQIVPVRTRRRIGQAHQGREGNLLPGRAARPHGRTPESG
jgi:non-heme chloroperoxidase